MSGGGKLLVADELVTHSINILCSPTDGKSHMEVHWGRKNRFRLDRLTSVFCVDNPLLEEAPPVAGFDTLTGSGTGQYNGVSGATATWSFTDAGEPGTSDSATIIIKDAQGQVLLSFQNSLTKGNQQAQPPKKR